MILADTSAWVEFLRGTGSQVNVRLRTGLERDDLATTDVVLMEVLAGARDDRHRERLRAMLRRADFVPTEGPQDYEDAAELYRICRHRGGTVRALTDCLIAVVALRAGLPVLHSDSDFTTIARHTKLAIV